MSYQEEGQVRPRRQLTKEAIALAMQGRWREAVAANISIIGSFPNDVDAYNRLGRAYIELGDYSRAQEAYERAMVGLEGDSQKAEPQHFIEETGKAGVVDLYHLAPPAILARMAAGDKVYLKINGTSLIVEDGRGEYLGHVDHKHGRQLIKLMKGGNKYTAAIISSTEDMMSIVIREVYQDPSQAGRLSFPAKGIEELRPYVGERMLRRELEYEEELVGEPGYTIVSEDGTELLPEESPDIDEEKASDEE